MYITFVLYTTSRLEKRYLILLDVQFSFASDWKIVLLRSVMSGTVRMNGGL